MKYLVTVTYDLLAGGEWSSDKKTLEMEGVPDVRRFAPRLNAVDLKALILQELGVPEWDVQIDTVTNVVSEDPIELPGGEQLVVFAMNLEAKEAAHAE